MRKSRRIRRLGEYVFAFALLEASEFESWGLAVLGVVPGIERQDRRVLDRKPPIVIYQKRGLEPKTNTKQNPR